MVLRILSVVAVAIAAVLAYAATRPDTIEVRRSIVVHAPPKQVFGLINDFHNWPRWAPQDREDPTMRRTFSGSQSGIGAISAWEGKGQTGKGTMLITESAAPARVTAQADWQRPFTTRNINEFTLEPAGTGTSVTWTMRGKNLFPMKLMGIFVSMDRMMGRHFESGLANLKTAAEQAQP